MNFNIQIRLEVSPLIQTTPVSMIILLSKLRSNQEATIKYSSRNVKIFHDGHKLWLLESGRMTTSKKIAHTFTVSSGIEITRFYKNETRIEFHFLDSLGEEHQNLNDFDEEHIYDCPNVTWEDKHKHIVP